MTTHPPPPADAPCHFALVRPARKPVPGILRRAVAAEAGFSEEDVMKIEFSVDETCSNIVRRACPGAERGRMRFELTLRLDPDGLTVRVRDEGEGGRPAQFRGAAITMRKRRSPGP